MEFIALAQQCAPAVHPATMAAVVRVESGFHPYAIGIVNGRLQRQPANKAEAVATAMALEKGGYNFSVGIGQVNRHNLSRYGLDYEKAFDPCENLRAGSAILTECFERARTRYKDGQQALLASFSCYYSGNFSTGFRPDFPGQPSYVQKIVNSAGEAGAADAAPIAAARQARKKRAKKSEFPVLTPGIETGRSGEIHELRGSDSQVNVSANVLVY